MANAIKKQANVFSKEALLILENELVMTKKVHTDYESEYRQKVNGYKKGEQISIQRPAEFTVREGASASAQNVVEGSTNIIVDQQVGVDVSFTSKELTLDIDSSGVRERVLEPAMKKIADHIDRSIMGLYKFVPNWSGTPGQIINSFADFAKGPERADELAIPQDGRCSILAPADHWGLLGSQTSLFVSDVAKGAYRMAKLGPIGGVDTYMSQNVPTHTVGAYAGTPLVKGASQNVTYAAAKDTANFSQTLITDGWSNSITGVLKAGDVFTIDGVFAVNPMSKAVLPFLRQFTVLEDANSDGSGNATLTITPAIITAAPNQTVSAAPANDAPITVLGTASTNYRQNLLFHKNAFAFVSVPMELPVDRADKSSRESYKGISLRLVPDYDWATDANRWRFDVLYGVKAIDPRLAIRMSGTA
jgi:hypothetical protein